MPFGTVVVAWKEHGSSLRASCLIWRLSQPKCMAIARHVMALFLNAAETLRSASSRSEASDLLRSISMRIKDYVLDYGVSISTSPLTIAFASVRGSLGLPSAVTSFGRTMERHGIISIAALVSASATAGHQDGGKSTWG